MDLLVLLKVAQSRELFAANVTLKGLVARVDTQVDGQVVLLSELSCTIRAAKGLLSGVRPQVQLQLSSTSEGLVAVEAGLLWPQNWFWSALLPFLGRFPFVALVFGLGRLLLLLRWLLVVGEGVLWLFGNRIGDIRVYFRVPGDKSFVHETEILPQS